MGKITWTDRDHRRLKRLYPIASKEDLMIAFPGRSYKTQICAAAKRISVKRAYVKWMPVSAESKINIEAFKELYPYFPNTRMARMFGLNYPVCKNLANKYSLTKIYEYNIGQYRKGMDSWNKGKTGYMGANKTSFKKGNLPANTKTTGDISIREDKCGRSYLWIKLSHSNWQMLHVNIWKEHNGALPSGKILRFIDGNSLNCVLENIEVVTRGEHAIRNAPWQTGNYTDKFVAHLLAGHRSRDIIPELMKETELLDVKRQQLILNQEIKENERRTEDAA
tara:strand:+ start:1853 stop:2689 length:837 start_codon:yes stop_codon:yes gene_type:complete